MFKLNNRYQEEAADGAEEGGAPDTGSLLDGAKPAEGEGEAPAEGTWFMSEGVAGEGERPEWYNADKYKSVSDQAAAYPELAKKMGAYTGAPEEYDLALPEGVNEHLTIDMEREGTKEFVEFAQEQGISQDFMAKALEFHSEAMMEALSDYLPDREAEMSVLGKDALTRVTNVSDWGQANLSEEQFDMLRSVTSTADGVQLVEALIGKTRENPTPDKIDPVVGGKTPEDLKALRYAKDEGGHLKIQTDPDYKKMVEEEYKKVYGTAPRETVVTL